MQKEITGVIIHKIEGQEHCLIKVNPLEIKGEDKDEYYCPVCMNVGQKNQVSSKENECLSCGVNLYWEKKENIQIEKAQIEKTDFFKFMENQMTSEKMDDYSKKMYEQGQLNPNNLSYWYPKVVYSGFNVPDTVVIPLTYEEFNWLNSDSYTEEGIQSFTSGLIERIKETNFNVDRELFMKTGNFSNKFSFTDCYVVDLNKIGEQFLRIYYAGMCCGCSQSPELVLRKFIKTTNERDAIYNGMKLNSEFRCFYDFDEKKLVQPITNYWDSETMLKNLEGNDKLVFIKNQENIEQSFLRLEVKLKVELQKHMASIKGLKGVWSVDFMWDGTQFWLIDMALAENSYYYDKTTK